ncbi:MAG: hypothetical protein HY903_03075 [Deltaproteobacteria bacterium]|nr:hypothetical protein [Deltaproteobacteria bacterium]
MRIAILFLLTFAAACGSTSYGASQDGVFPPRPAGSAAPTFEHMCVVVGRADTRESLNDAGSKGWELVGMGPFKADTLMCFKREKSGT